VALVRPLTLALLFVPVTAMAQGTTRVRTLDAQVRVRVGVSGLDSTAWFAADIRHTRDGCELIQLRQVAWQDGRPSIDSQVPMNDRAVLTPRHLREMQTRATETAPWRTVDLAWFQARWKPEC